LGRNTPAKKPGLITVCYGDGETGGGLCRPIHCLGAMACRAGLWARFIRVPQGGSLKRNFTGFTI